MRVFNKDGEKNFWYQLTYIKKHVYEINNGYQVAELTDEGSYLSSIENVKFYLLARMPEYLGPHEGIILGPHEEYWLNRGYKIIWTIRG